MDLLILIAEPVPFWKAMLYMGLGTLLIVIMMAAGSYLFIRVIASHLNSRRDSWTATSTSLGLSPDQSRGVMLKTLTGNRGKHVVTVEPFAVPTGRYSSDAYAAVEVKFETPLDFSVQISKPEMLYQKVAGFFNSNESEIGFDIFDKAFHVECSHLPSLQQLLNTEMLDGHSSTLLTDLMLANKKYYRVKMTDRSICLGVRAELTDTEIIEATIEKAIYLADRVAEARRRVKQEQ